jgi:hypothetical protein
VLLQQVIRWGHGAKVVFMTSHYHVSLLNDRWTTSLASRRQSCGKESNNRLTNYDIEYVW